MAKGWKLSKLFLPNRWSKKKKNIKTLNRRYVNKCKTEGQLYIIFQIRWSMRLSNKILKEVCYLRKTWKKKSLCPYSFPHDINYNIWIRIIEIRWIGYNYCSLFLCFFFFFMITVQYRCYTSNLRGTRS